MHHTTKVDVLDGLYRSSIQLLHPALLVLEVADLQFLAQAAEGAQRRPNDQVRVLGLDLLPSRPSVFWFCRVSTGGEI